MNCDEVQTALTLYLDGDLDVDRGRVVRGHLRGCAPCRAIAHQESVLRDGLRALPTVDPPPELWRGITRRLADAEIADAAHPPWRQAMARWKRAIRGVGIATAGLTVALAGVGLVGIWRGRHPGGAAAWPTPMAGAVPLTSDEVPCSSSGPRDVAYDLKAEPACVTDAYAVAANSLIEAAFEQRVQWTDEHKAQFDTELDRLRRAVNGSGEGRSRQRSYRALIRYLQRATNRDEVAVARTRGVP